MSREEILREMKVVGGAEEWAKQHFKGRRLDAALWIISPDSWPKKDTNREARFGGSLKKGS